MTDLRPLFLALADALDGDLAIEKRARDALVKAAPATPHPPFIPLSHHYDDILSANDCHPVCALIQSAPISWTPPTTSNDPAYVEDSKAKAHVEILGPGGFAHHDNLRIGLYGMQAGYEYGIRTHPAEEVFVMLAGSAEWKRGQAPYSPQTPGAPIHHPSMTPHANRTTHSPFMSVYVWSGDVSTENYKYSGRTND